MLSHGNGVDEAVGDAIPRAIFLQGVFPDEAACPGLAIVKLNLEPVNVPDEPTATTG